MPFGMGGLSDHAGGGEKAPGVRFLCRGAGSGIVTFGVPLPNDGEDFVKAVTVAVA